MTNGFSQGELAALIDRQFFMLARDHDERHYLSDEFDDKFPNSEVSLAAGWDDSLLPRNGSSPPVCPLTPT